MKIIATAALGALLLTGCQSILNARFPPGQLGPDGKVYPCNEYRTNAQACGEALFNAPRVAKLTVGMTLAEARTIMVRDPEERSARTENGKQVEVWGYLTNYDRTTISRIMFVDGKIAAIEASGPK